MSAFRAVRVLAAGTALAGLAGPGCALGLADEFAAPEQLAVVADRRISEASGIVASRRHPGCFYVHNDSGNAPEVFLLDMDGVVRAVIRLEGAVNRDWEDIAWRPAAPAAGPAPDSAPAAGEIVVADIGDNREHRAHVTFYRFAEPPLDAAAGVGQQLSVHPEQHTLRYPDRPRNAEALVIDPHRGDAYIIAKEPAGHASIFRLAAPWPTDGGALEACGALNLPAAGIATMVVGADVSGDGRVLVTRSYTGGWVFTRGAPGASDAGLAPLFAVAPEPLSLAVERQGEAICFSADGDALFTIAEGSPTALWRVARVASP